MSGKRPAIAPAANIRFADWEKGNSEKGELPNASVDCFLDADVFLPFSHSPFSFSFFMAAHHCVNTIAASGIPSRNPRCGTSRLVTALPQRQVFATSGIVYECEMCVST